MSKRQLVLDALNNKETERTPVGFWFHFVTGDEFYLGLEKPELIKKNLDGHLKFYRDFQPDFIKIMSDGFFAYPNPTLEDIRKKDEWKSLEPVGSHHPWIEKQVELVKKLTDTFGSDIVSIYNIFAPATFFKLLYEDEGNQVLARLIKEDPDIARHVLDVIAEDLAVLAKRVITEGGTDGIYLSVQNVQDERVTKEEYADIVGSSEQKVLTAANSVSENNILHICGYEGSRNDLSIYREYSAKAYNWAVNVEGVGLTEGKKLFGGKAVIGGFANGPESLIHKGSKEEIEAFTKKLLLEAGQTGIILGADCTVSSNIELQRLQWVRNQAAEFTQA